MCCEVELGARALEAPLPWLCIGGIVEEYTLDSAVSNPNHVAELFSLELYNKIRTEPNLQYGR